jgi:probable F420-dependent oxidoreductase
VEIGVRIPHTGGQASPEFVREWCVAAERAGFASLWGVDHVLPRTPASIADDAVSDLLSPNFELVTTLAFVAAITERIKLGTAVQVLPIRNAVLNARQLATIDRYADGRLVCGIGVGWLKEEADAMNMPWDRRGARVNEQIALLRAMWTAPGRHVEFHGEFWDIPPTDPEPRPVQRPIPILIGGHSDSAIDRAARIGDGWIAAAMSSDRLSELLPNLHASAERYGRTPSSLPVYCGARPGARSLDDLRRYQDLGVHSLEVRLETIDELKRFADDVLPRLG